MKQKLLTIASSIGEVLKLVGFVFKAIGEALDRVADVFYDIGVAIDG